MKIFITGSTGFVGQHLVKNLQKKDHKLLLLIREQSKYPPDLPENIEVVKGSLSDIKKWIDIVKDFKLDAAIHLAWEGIPNYNSEMSIKNLKYGLNLMKMLVEIDCKKVIFAGSCWEYGGQPGEISEDTPTKPFNAFTAAKNSLHWLVKEIAKENNIQFIWTRFFYVYGPGQKETSIIPYLINCAEEGEIPEIKNLYAKNDFVYVGDVAEALSLLVKKCKNSGVYNIGSGKLTSVKNIVKIIFGDYKFKQDKKVRQVDALTDFYADISKIKKEVGWEPKVSIKEGIRKMIKFLSNNK